MNKHRANELLSLGIRTLKGEVFSGRIGPRMQHAIHLKDVLLEAGFWWQADKLDGWISYFYNVEGRGSS